MASFEYTINPPQWRSQAYARTQVRNIENPVHGLCDFFSIAVFSEREVLKVIATSQPVITDYETPLHNAISKAQLQNTADSLQKDSSQRHCYLHGCL